MLKTAIAKLGKHWGIVALLLTSALPSFASDNLSLGTPGKADQIIDHEGYALGYDYNWKIPRWVTYRLTIDEIASPKAGRSEDFRPDPMLKAGAAQLEDYRGSGYDRGHMAPAADMKWSTKVMSECFYLSNMCPQNRQNNGGIWNEIEQTVRGFATAEKSVFVVTGPIFWGKKPMNTIGANKVAVPDGFYKVVYDETPPEKMIAFVVHNQPMPGKPKDYSCSVASVEKTTGLKFFDKLPTDKQALKTKCDPTLWNWSKSQPSSAFKPVAKAESEDHQLCGTALVEQAEMDAWNRGERTEYRPGGAMPVSSRKAAPVCINWPDTGYWLSTNSNKRHNEKCENYRKTRGYPCFKEDGVPCKICGG